MRQGRDRCQSRRYCLPVPNVAPSPSGELEELGPSLMYPSHPVNLKPHPCPRPQLSAALSPGDGLSCAQSAPALFS